MTPAELAARHPSLYHLTCTDNVPDIQAHGIHPAATLFDSFGQAHLATTRRAAPIRLQNVAGRRATVSDNAPLTEAALAKCLDPGLTPQDWLYQLNRRVFFWADEARLAKLVNARNNRNRAKSVLVVDTLRFAEAYRDNIELCPINSGSTIHKPTRRGLATFTPLGRLSFAEWRVLRGYRDTICEVTVCVGIPDLIDFVIEIREPWRSI